MPQSNRLKLPSASLKRQIANKAEWNKTREPGQANFYTFGYSGRKTGEIIELLLRYGVRTVVDVRQNPVSMYRPELSKKNFHLLLQENGIGYAHVPRLGVPKEIRARALETGSREVIWAWYDSTVLPGIADLASFLGEFEGPIAFMCTEVDPHECHRHRLALALERAGLTGFDL